MFSGPSNSRMVHADEDAASAPLKKGPQANVQKGAKREHRHSVGDMATEAFRKVESIVLYAFHQAPPYQQDNQYIVGGYRGELKSFKGCIESLWYLHNETGIAPSALS
jgi:hypothetical protein